MNLLCFTLEGSTESIYEPACKPALNDVHARHRWSPAAGRHKHDWGGSDPAISSDRPERVTKQRRSSRRSCVLTLENKTLADDTDLTCWRSSDEKKKGQKRPTSWSSVLGGDDQVKDVSSETTRRDLIAQCDESTNSTPTTGRLKKLQNLVQARKGHLADAEKVKRAAKRKDCLADVMRNNTATLSCISLRRTETTPPTATSPQHPLQQHSRRRHDDKEGEEAWSPKTGTCVQGPLECPQPWTLVYHTCQQRRHEKWMCGVNFPLPRSPDWDRFESLLQELDSKQSALSHPQMLRSITDLSNSPNSEEQGGHKQELELQRREVESSSQSEEQKTEASPEETETLHSTRDAERKGCGHQTCPKGHKRCRNSLESLSSLHSGRSSSSGVTSGSDCSSNRDSMRLEDDLSLTRQFCGRARVHTDYVPSPYDTESLKLKVGDVINITAKPPMGIWTGLLNGRIGNFKFIYVDVLPEPRNETVIHEVRHKSAVGEVLKRLSLEEYSSPLQLSGYQTVADLMRLTEQDLMQLNVTDPGHRQRLLAALTSLQKLCSEGWLENDSSCGPENVETNNSSRDSGCVMTSESPDDCAEDSEPPFPSEKPQPAAMTAP